MSSYNQNNSEEEKKINSNDINNSNYKITNSFNLLYEQNSCPAIPAQKKYPAFPIKNIYQPQLFINNNDFMDRFKCGLCENICEEPRYQYCGCEQVYCKKCLDFYYDVFHHRCPRCQKETKELEPTETFKNSILNLNMKCKNYDINCQWIGKFKDYKDHIEKNCLKEIINCPNKGCVIKLPRENMQCHLPKCQYCECICEKCQMKLIVMERNVHKNFCPKEKIPCPKACGTLIERDSLFEHESICPNSFIDCPYKDLGCNDKYINKEKEQKLFNDSSKHLDLAINKIRNLEGELQELKKKIKELENDKYELREKINILNELINIRTSDPNSFNLNQSAQSLSRNGKLVSLLKIEDNNSPADESMNNVEKINKSQSCNDLFNNQEDQNLYLSKKRKIINYNQENNKSESPNKEFSLFQNNEQDKSKDKEYYLEYEEKNNQIYELFENISNLFEVRDNIIEATYLNGTRHYFVFYNQKYNIPKYENKRYEFEIKLLDKCDWLAFGVCDKNIVEKNNFEFDIKKSGKKKNTGVYIMNTNQIIWNCNNMKQCIKLKYKSLNKKNSTIKCTLTPSECELEFIFNKEFFITLNDVRCFESEYFSPCLIFLKNVSIETNFHYGK
jgi:hypothetical protein